MKEPEHYLKCGYEDHGYVSPELSSSDTYPEYIEQEVKRCVKEIQSHQGYDTLTFAFITDIHYALSYNHSIRLKRMLNAYKEIQKRVHIDKLILGGDYTNEGCKEYKYDCFRKLRAEFSGIDYFPINGNHDDGSIWDRDYIKQKNAVNHLTHEDLYRVFYNHLPSKGAMFDKNNAGLYYYLDDEINKVRYICIDSCDIPYMHKEDGSLRYAAQHLFTVSQKQYEWLINEALVFNEDSWSVIFISHSVALPTENKENLGDIRVRMSLLKELIEAYKKGGQCSLKWEERDLGVNIDADFSHYKRAEVICCMVGDYHIDAVVYDNGNTPYVLTANAVTYCTPEHELQRCDGDKTELLFDIVTVNKKERKLYITRVGAGKDRVVEY